MRHPQISYPILPRSMVSETDMKFCIIRPPGYTVFLTPVDRHHTASVDRSTIDRKTVRAKAKSGRNGPAYAPVTDGAPTYRIYLYTSLCSLEDEQRDTGNASEINWVGEVREFIARSAKFEMMIDSCDCIKGRASIASKCTRLRPYMV